jgi:ubiquinone/menaquinone biosynthesis C-methylase UbiE
MPVDKSGSRIRQMFGEIAGRYDFMNHFLSAGTDVYWRWQAVRMAAPFNNSPILDVCTGTGDLAFAFRKKLNGEATVFATDFTHGMLKLAEEKRSDRDVVFLEADTLSLPFPSDKFQVVSVAFNRRAQRNDPRLSARREGAGAGVFTARQSTVKSRLPVVFSQYPASAGATTGEKSAGGV